jgi:hypothetical protein
MQTFQITLPPPHPAQAQVLSEAKRFNVLECGRRFGKTTLGVRLLISAAIKGQPVAWFAPTHKLLFEPWDLCSSLLAGGLRSRQSAHHQLRLPGAGAIDFWSLDRPDAGRGRKYARIVVDEAGLVRRLKHTWENALRPTLTDFKGDAWFLGTPNGKNDFHALFNLGKNKVPGWASWRWTTADNPHIDPAEIQSARAQLSQDAFMQEYLAQPVESAAKPFDDQALADCLGSLSSNPPASIGVDLARSQDYTAVVGLDEHGHVCLLDRWQSSWNQTRARLLRLISDTPTLIDSTGVGDPIVEDLSLVLPSVEGFRFTASSRPQLMAGLALAIQTRAIRLPEGWLSDELASLEPDGECDSHGNVKFAAPAGLHDDGVMALALAWRGLKTQQQSPTLQLQARWV